MLRGNVFSHNAVLSGYARLGMAAAARRVFDRMDDRDLVSWNTMIFGLARGWQCREAVDLYVRMRRCFPEVNGYTFSGVLIACVRLGRVRLTRQFHGQVFCFGMHANVVISSSLIDAYAKCGDVGDAGRLFDEMPLRDVQAWTALLAAYAKCGDMSSARKLFDEMPERNLISWSAMITGYVQNGLPQKAVEVFNEMIELGVALDQFAISGALCACADIAYMRFGKQIHCLLVRSHFRANAVTLSSLINMYSKCGDLTRGWRIFEKIPCTSRDVVLWNTMISAFGQHGLGEVVMRLFYTMIKSGTMPDCNTFVIVLTACSHSGLVREGTSIFHSMARDHGIFPNEEHNACFVDLLGRAGHFEEAKQWVYRSRYSSSTLMWRALLGACRIHGNVELVTEAAGFLLKVDPQWSAAYVLLANTYAGADCWDSVEKVRYLMEYREVKKEKALSMVETSNSAHPFSVFGRFHPLISDTCRKLLSTNMQCRNK